MSLFESIDLLVNRIRTIKNGPSFLIQVQHLFSQSAKTAYIQAVREEEIFLTNLLENFSIRTQNDNYNDLVIEELQIIAYLTQHPTTSSRKLLVDIKSDLLEIIRRKRLYQLSPTPINQELLKYESRKYKIADLNQATDFRLGLSQGECFGFTYAMADPNLSPYNKDNTKSIVTLQQKIHDYQKNQLDKALEINCTRITGRNFCPNIPKQAEELFSIADRNRDKEFLITLQAYGMAHATYISVQKNGDIRFMDPNYGAYLFNTKNEFIDFYRLIYTSEDSLRFPFYQLSQISYQPTPSKEEPKTLMGKVRSFLTGSKYQALKYRIMDGLRDGLLAGALTLIALLINPIFGIVLTLIITGLYLAAALGGYKGLLAIPHFLMECWDRFKRKFIDHHSDALQDNLSEPEPGPSATEWDSWRE